MLQKPQVDYIGAYSKIGQDVRGFLSSIPERIRQEKEYKFKSDKEKQEWDYIQGQMQDEKGFKTTMTNLVDNLTGENYSPEEKDAIKKEIMADDSKTAGAKVAEFVSSKNYLDQIRQKYPGATFPKPIYGQTLQHYQQMVQVATGTEEAKSIGAAMAGPQAQPALPQPKKEPGEEFYSNEQIQKDVQGLGAEGTVPGSQPAGQPPKTQTEATTAMLNQGIDVSSPQAKEAVRALPTATGIMKNQTALAGQAAKAEQFRQTREDKAKSFEETKRWHDMLAEIMKARNSISQGKAVGDKMINTQKVILAQKAANTRLDNEIRSSNKNIRDLEKKKRGLQEEIASSQMIPGNEGMAEQLKNDIANIDLNIMQINNDISDFEAEKQDIQEGLDMWQKEVMPNVSKGQGYEYPKPASKEKPAAPASGSAMVTPSGKKVTIRVK